MVHRRFFLESVSAAGFAMALSASGAAWAQGRRERPPQLAADLVEEFVSVAHSDLAAVQRLLKEQPALVNATWDWGGGDFETALGGASHMGNREIALFLLAEGARIDLFAAAMLGRLDIVQAALTFDPHLLEVPGPHGIPLISHAKKGGDEAKEVLAYLGSLSS